MKMVNIIASLLFFLMTLLSISSAQAITSAVSILVEHETQANPVLSRPNTFIQIPHLEIPLSEVETDFADRLSPEIRQTLIFQKQGRPFVRWILNPEDKTWFKEIIQHFAQRGIVLKKEYYFQGYRTASRSYIVENPEGTVQFSVKSSTDTLENVPVSKKQPIKDAIDSRLMADYLLYIQKHQEFEHVVIMDEPAILKLPQLDQSVVIRTLADLDRPEKGLVYLPGFSVLHESVGAQIAARNGSQEPYAFWSEHYIKAVGRAMGEFAARTGLQFKSAHSQNFLVEFDQNLRPTGRIVLRDLADFVINRRIVRAAHPRPQEFFAKYQQSNDIVNELSVSFAPLLYTHVPYWMNEAQYTKWMPTYYQAFENSFVLVSGVPLDAMKIGQASQTKRYFDGYYLLEKNGHLNHPAINQYLRRLAKPKFSPDRCSAVFAG